VHGVRFLNGNGTNAFHDDNGHGTMVSGIIAAIANNTIGIAGVSPEVEFLPCKFMDSTGQGAVSDALACWNYCLSKGANVLHNSWGSYTINVALNAAAQAAQAQGVLIVASAGNDGSDDDRISHYPSGLSVQNKAVLSVANADKYGDVAATSNFGNSSVQLAAPGQDIVSTALGGAWNVGSGTSFAAPHVSGAAVLLLSHIQDLGIEITGLPSIAELVAWAITNSTSALSTRSAALVRGGLLNVSAAIAAVDSNLTAGGTIGSSTSKVSGVVAGVIGAVVGVAVTFVAGAAFFVWFVRRRTTETLRVLAPQPDAQPAVPTARPPMSSRHEDLARIEADLQQSAEP
jgi:subtilisin family serine protease